MTPEDKELLLKDLCARLPYGVKVMKQIKSQTRTLMSVDVVNFRVYFIENDVNSPFGFDIEEQRHFYQQIKPYLRPLSCMTDEEAKEIAVLYGLKNILSLKITGRYIDVIIDDGFSSTETITLWYDELISSIGCFDWLNAHHFDYRGLIPKGLANEAPEGMYN